MSKAAPAAERQYPHVLKAVFDTPWAITPEMLGLIAEVARFRAEGGTFSEEEIQQRIEAQQVGPRNGGQRAGRVAVIPIYGVLSQRMDLMSAMSGGTSTEALTGQFRDALADPEVSSIVFDIDSPGGSVDGIEEFATEVFQARGQKRIVAVANSMAASAAYWIAAQADEVVVTPSGSVGSIGILAIHEDFSRARDAAGITTTFITAGKFKAEGHEDLPLSDEAIAYIQAQADEFYGTFVAAVAKGRGVTAATARGADFGQGRVLLAKAAKAVGMVDRIATLDATVQRLALKAQGRSGFGAELPSNDLVALALGRPYSERLALASALAADLAESTDRRIALRGQEGRGLSADNRAGLLALSEHLGAMAAQADEPGGEQEPTPDPTPEPVPPDEPLTVSHIGLAVFEAAVAGGYRLSDAEVTPS